MHGSARFWVLLVGRILQAVSTGILLPFMTTIAMVSFPPGCQATAMGIAGGHGLCAQYRAYRGRRYGVGMGLAQLLRSSGGSDLRVDAVRPGAGEALEAA